MRTRGDIQVEILWRGGKKQVINKYDSFSSAMFLNVNLIETLTIKRIKKDKQEVK